MLGRVGSSSEASWKKIAAHILSLNTNTKGPQQQLSEASSLYFSLLIGYRVQALTVVKPSEEQVRSAQRAATGGPPSEGGLGGRQEAPTASPPTQLQAQATLETQQEEGTSKGEIQRGQQS